MHGFEKFILINDYRTAGIPVPKYLQEWDAEAVQNWRSGKKSFASAFGILDTKTERRIRRNFELKNYSNGLSGSLWAKAKFLEDKLKQIDTENSYASPSINHSVKMIDTIYPLPRTQRQLYSILKSEILTH